ncbi:unnamed protein product [Vitrella brassicaformis CCMP3155]|uniref:C3H1-type domain-containing protein n=1 Tax=Vitrella brassicaformis (strain CCMP3155) TaxID=1169540 RepID=A0A0G4EPD8_VITBC|nr:unnamed protein product [Vitrella brassicaformis CCMP3155]|eukprot:CEL99115.1 unnamed protein product [Vitrella brassicaformis CCMP3155]
MGGKDPLLWRTGSCDFQRTGWCTSESCPYAHSYQERRTYQENKAEWEELEKKGLLPLAAKIPSVPSHSRPSPSPGAAHPPPAAADATDTKAATKPSRVTLKNVSPVLCAKWDHIEPGGELPSRPFHTTHKFHSRPLNTLIDGISSAVPTPVSIRFLGRHEGISPDTVYKLLMHEFLSKAL